MSGYLKILGWQLNEVAENMSLINHYVDKADHEMTEDHQVDPM